MLPRVGSSSFELIRSSGTQAKTLILEDSIHLLVELIISRVQRQMKQMFRKICFKFKISRTLPFQIQYYPETPTQPLPFSVLFAIKFNKATTNSLIQCSLRCICQQITFWYVHIQFVTFIPCSQDINSKILSQLEIESPSSARIMWKHCTLECTQA